MIKRTDMAIEFCKDKNSNIKDNLDEPKIKYSLVELDKALSKKYSRPVGKYITLESSIVKDNDIPLYDKLSGEIAKAFKTLSPSVKNVLVVGLGNPNLTADALGSRVFNNLVVTRHIKESRSSISAICPNVMGATGIESFDVIKGVVDRIKPELVIVADSLASASVSRIGAAFQLCSSGITPGSGVANHRIRLDKSSLGVDVVSVGVPLVVYASTIVLEAAGENSLENLDEEFMGLIVTPKDIDLLVSECGKVIADGINRAFVPELI